MLMMRGTRRSARRSRPLWSRRYASGERGYPSGGGGGRGEVRGAAWYPTSLRWRSSASTERDQSPLGRRTVSPTRTTAVPTFPPASASSPELWSTSGTVPQHDGQPDTDMHA